METYQAIENDINAVKEWHMEAGNALHAQMHHAQNASWSFDELSEYMKSDNDVADEYFSDDESKHAEVRNIQDSIIGFYAEG